MSKKTGKRLYPLDALRGLIIVFMALDHANYFIAQQHSPGEYWGGPFPAYNSALPFLTRLVTHFSAPGFFFLMGVGMLLFADARWRQGWSTWKIRGHFWIRGTILIALQLFVINPIWKAGPSFFPETYIGVLIALGGMMILGSFLFRLNPIVLLLLTLGLLIGTEWLHPSPGVWGQLTNDPWNLTLMRSGGTGELWSNFPVLPWLELVVFGMLFGRWLLDDEKKAYQKGLWIGVALLVLFVILRSADGFGNIRPRTGGTWIDFLNVVKYPPSLTFTFLTMGVNLIVLWGFLKAGERFQMASRPIVAFGRAPLFVYILHLYLYMLMGRSFAPHGSSLPVMYLYWLAGLAILYLAALWYGRFKHSDSPLRGITSYL
ncbi:MAG: heparan-alpha-glucosaminide N-acetyltransferase domain-containing protein [Anaerolineales bacterium]